MRRRSLYRLNKMRSYCLTDRCLRQVLLEYFGEPAPDNCGHCGNCLSGTVPVEMTRQAQMFLCCALRTGQKYGSSTLISVLRGSKAPAVLERGLNAQSTYGLWKEQVDPKLAQRLVGKLEEAGYIRLSEGDYPVVKVTQKAKSLLSGAETLYLRLPKEEAEPAPVRKEGLHPASQQLFQQLRLIRKELAAPGRDRPLPGVSRHHPAGNGHGPAGDPGADAPDQRGGAGETGAVRGSLFGSHPPVPAKPVPEKRKIKQKGRTLGGTSFPFSGLGWF